MQDVILKLVDVPLVRIVCPRQPEWLALPR